MEKRLLGQSDIEVSVIGLGTMSWPGCRYGAAYSTPSSETRQEVSAIVSASLDSGIQLIDTAEGYGRGVAEELLGAALKESGRRDEAVIVSKGGPLFAEEQTNGRGCDLSTDHLLARCEASLERLGTDYLDVYLAHWPDPLTPLEETMAAAAKLKQQGKIRAFGVSNFGVDLMRQALKHGEIAVNQLPYSLVDREIEGETLPFCVKSGMGVMAYSPLGKGVLSGKYDADHLPPPEDYRHQRKHFEAKNLERHFRIVHEMRKIAETFSMDVSHVALRWVLAQQGISTVLVGAKNVQQSRNNSEAMQVELPSNAFDCFS